MKIFAEHYRPQTIQDCILTESNKTLFNNILESKTLPNMIFYGSSGLGKTSVAKAICNDLGVDYTIINASLNNGVDYLRTTIMDFASTLSFSNSRKCVILDECERLSTATFESLRNFIEEFSENCSFIFTCNFQNRIPDAIHSRCTLVDFSINKDEKQKMIVAYTKKLLKILQEEKVEASNKLAISVVSQYFPDFRKVLNEVQSKIHGNVLDISVLHKTEDVSILMDYVSKRNFDGYRKWLAENVDNNVDIVLKSIINYGIENYSGTKLESFIITMAECQFRLGFVLDKELQLLASLTEISTL